MKDEKIQEQILDKYNYLIEKGYNVIYLGLQGSQNYGLDIYDEDYKSDVDVKAIVVPTLEDIVLNRKPISTTIVLENNEHIDVKDIRVMMETFKKQNINYIEILFTKYYCVNSKYEDLINLLIENREKIAHFNYNQALRCIAGMSMEKLKALQHPYPTLLDKIEKFGYDPKQLHHILRMNDFIKKYISGMSYEDCLIPDNKEYLIDIKKGILSCEDAVNLANKIDAETSKIMHENLKENEEVDKEVEYIMKDVTYLIIKRALLEEMKGE